MNATPPGVDPQQMAEAEILSQNVVNNLYCNLYKEQAKPLPSAK